jgi:hypothetical protein
LLLIINQICGIFLPLYFNFYIFVTLEKTHYYNKMFINRIYEF